jgi:hypothetical protein
MVAMRLDDADTAGHLLMHVDECHADQGASQYKHFYDIVAKDFVLRSGGKPDVPAHATRGYWTDATRGVHDFYLRVEPQEFESMERGVAYELAALAQHAEARWVVKSGVTITRARR